MLLCNDQQEVLSSCQRRWQQSLIALNIPENSHFHCIPMNILKFSSVTLLLASVITWKLSGGLLGLVQCIPIKASV